MAKERPSLLIPLVGTLSARLRVLSAAQSLRERLAISAISTISTPR
jgi:hypothetical protein